MVTLLKGLLGKVKRPIIVNGKLLTVGRSQVVVGLTNYHVVFSVLGSGDELDTEAGETLIKKSLQQFSEQFGAILDGSDIVDSQESLDAFVDSFTGAIVIESQTYRAIYAERMHESGTQHRPEVALLVKDFVTYYTNCWMDIYVNLYNRRIGSPHSPIATRAHFVAGFFQPLLISSAALRSPLEFGQNEWFYQIFSDSEEFLERSHDYVRNLSLSCVAMCDIANCFNVPVVTELDRLDWVLMCMLVLLSQLDKDASVELSKRYGSIFKRIMGRKESVVLFSSMMDYANKIRTAVRVR